ncbi:MAG: hypothetical protein ACYCPP_08235 [Nitrososphaerales archaeon]
MALTDRKKQEIRALSDASYEALVAVAKNSSRAQSARRTVRPREIKIKPKVTTSRKL